MSYTRDYNSFVEDMFKDEVKGYWGTLEQYLNNADEIYQQLLKDYPKVIYIKIGKTRYFAITQEAKNHLLNIFQNQKADLEEELYDPILLEELKEGMKEFNHKIEDYYEWLDEINEAINYINSVEM